jgi:hypothetical protein
LRNHFHIWVEYIGALKDLSTASYHYDYQTFINQHGS